MMRNTLAFARNFALFLPLLASCVDPVGDLTDTADDADRDEPGEDDAIELDVAGTYHLTTSIALTTGSLAPTPVREALELLSDFRAAPAATLVRLLDDAGVPLIGDLEAALPSALESRVYGWLDRAILSALDGAALDGVDVLLDAADLVVAEPDLHSTLVLGRPDATGHLAASHALGAVSFVAAGRSLEVPLTIESLAPTASLVATVGATVGGTRSLGLGDHAFGLAYGGLLLAAIERSALDRTGLGFRAALGRAVDCPAVAAEVAARCVLGVCVGHRDTLEELCERGLDELVAEVEERLAAERLDVLRFRAGVATVAGASVAGAWTGELDLGDGPRALDASFAGPRE